MYIISRCLLGVNCKYNGGNNLTDSVVEFTQSHTFTAVCPETEGGLKAPRVPAEQVRRVDGSFDVINRDGGNWTEEFIKGARLSLQRALKEAAEKGEVIEGAILKARSPSCGYGEIYDGSFTSTRVSGDGVFAQLLWEEYERRKNATTEDGVIFAKDFRIVTEEEI